MLHMEIMRKLSRREAFAASGLALAVLTTTACHEPEPTAENVVLLPAIVGVVIVNTRTP